VFLFSDTQVKDESFIEDISNLLNTYEVPNLLGSGDLAGIFENIRPRAKQAGQDGNKDTLYNFFVQEVCRGYDELCIAQLGTGHLFCPGIYDTLGHCL
jgi:dynein heavy chain